MVDLSIGLLISTEICFLQNLRSNRNKVVFLANTPIFIPKSNSMVTLCTCPLMPSNRKSMSKMSASKSSGASTTKKDQYEKKNEERKKEKKKAKIGVSCFFP